MQWKAISKFYLRNIQTKQMRNNTIEWQKCEKKRKCETIAVVILLKETLLWFFSFSFLVSVINVYVIVDRLQYNRLERMRIKLRIKKNLCRLNGNAFKKKEMTKWKKANRAASTSREIKFYFCNAIMPVWILFFAGE